MYLYMLEIKTEKHYGNVPQENTCGVCGKPLKKGKKSWYCENTSYPDEFGNIDVCPMWGKSVNVFGDPLREEGIKIIKQIKITEYS